MVFSKLFGGSKKEPEAQTETYKDFTITAAPQKDPGGWRIGAVITKGDKTHQLIRADVIQDRDTADEASTRKAKQMIDEQGDRLFL